MNIRSAFAHSMTLVCVAVLLAGCGRKSSDNSPVVATVNREDITQAQLDYARTQIAAAHPGASAPDAGVVLQGLVEQRLASQKAEKDKLDRSPGVQQALEATRKDALARFYIEQLTAKVPKPSADEIQKYYDAHPQNFAQRSVYEIQKVDAKVAPDQVQALAASVQALGSAAEVVDLLKAKATSINVSQTPQPAESLGPLLPRITALAVGHSIALPQQQGLSVLTVIATRPQPVALAQAQASIEQLLWNQRKREALQAEAKSLRAAAKIDYLGKFAPGAASAPAGGAPTPAAPDAASAASQ